MNAAAEFEAKVHPDNLEEGYASIWDIAFATTGKDEDEARRLAGLFLGFLCKMKFEYMVMTADQAKYLDRQLEKDEDLMGNWKPESEWVDVVAQNASVPFDVFANFLKAKKFDPAGRYNPRKATRINWFQNLWNVG